MMCAMSASKDSERPPSGARARQEPAAGEDPGVLSKLPRTRPQRSSPRRVAARKASATATAATATAAPARSNGRPPAQLGKPVTAPKRAVKPPVKRAPKPFVAAEPAPRQGFESEGERASESVHPPGGAELVASAAEIVGELAKAGISTGERLLKDFLSRLPLS
jgi:hypothetical protein